MRMTVLGDSWQTVLLDRVSRFLSLLARRGSIFR
jgi:hypothetical protein